MVSKSRFQRTHPPEGVAKRISCTANASSTPTSSTKERHRTALFSKKRAHHTPFLPHIEEFIPYIKTSDIVSMKTVGKSNKNIVYHCHYHIVFCPRYRRKVLVNGVDTRLKTLITQIVEQWGQTLIEVEVMPDHVHLVVGCDPQLGIHRLVKSIKGTSSHQLRQEFPHLKQKLPECGTNRYFCGTVGGVTEDSVKRYVENQKGK